MKKLIIILSVLALCLSSCGAKDNIQSTNNDAQVIANDAVPSPIPGIEEPKNIKMHPIQAVEPVYKEDGYQPAALMYHLIMEEPYNNLEALFVRPDDFAQSLDAINKAGYTYLFANDYRKTESKSVVITFDDGYEDNYTTMFPILKKYNARATIFLISDCIDTDGYMTTAQIKEMADSGYVYFGCHTKTHCNLASQTTANIDMQLKESQKKIKEITDQDCAALAYPGGKFNDDVVKIAGNYFKYAYTTRSPHSYPDFTALTISRFYAARSLSASALMKMIAY